MWIGSVPRWQWIAVLGMIFLVLGWGMISNPLLTIRSMLIIVGIALICAGVYGIIASKQAPAERNLLWGAICCMVLGVASILLTRLTAEVWAYVIAVQSLVAGIVQAALIIEVRHEPLPRLALILSAALSLLLGLLLFLKPITAFMAFLAFFGLCALVGGILLMIIALDAATNGPNREY